jgi:hypothetical protein
MENPDLGLAIPTAEFNVPPEYFKMESVDDDTIRWHLQETPSQQVHIAALLADCEYYMHSYELAAKQRSASMYLLFKSKPYKRYLSKGQAGFAMVDASDEVSQMVSKADYLVNEYLKHALIWRRQRDKLRGAMEACETKRMFVASLAGLRRTELQAINGRTNNE